MPKREEDDEVRVTVRLPASLVRSLKKRAIDKDLKIQEAVREAVALWLKS